MLEVQPADPASLSATAGAVAGAVDEPLRVDAERAVVPVAVSGGDGALTRLVRRLADAGIELADVSLHRPSLDDVFLSLTGRAAAEEPSRLRAQELGRDRPHRASAGCAAADRSGR